MGHIGEVDSGRTTRPRSGLRLSEVCTVVGVVVALATACAGAPGAGSGNPEPAREAATGGPAAPGAPGSAQARARAALARWRGFPVDRPVRPIVVVNGSVREAGYVDNEAKLASLAGWFQLATALPDAPASTEVSLPGGGHAVLPLSAPGSALAMLRQRHQGDESGTSPEPLRIVAVALGTAEFATDRGPASLPAWRFTVERGLAPLDVLALAPSALWPVPAEAAAGPGTARLGAGGRSLVVPLPAPREPCPGGAVVQYEPRVAESRAAVAVYLDARDTGSRAPGRRSAPCIDDLVLRFRSYEVALAAPLGRRVLVDESGAPVPVTVD